MTHDYDIIIVGGGAVGAALACALGNNKGNSSLRIAVVEAVSSKSDIQPSYDDRGLSISLSSKNILDNLGLWENISPHSNPVRNIHVSDQHHFGFVRMDAKSMNVPALGYIVLARELGKAFIENVELASHLANVGDSKTLIIHPATTTHSRIDAEALVAAGITDDMIRLSVGLEDVADIQADFETGFRAAKKIANS